jgi:hypothetical protein
VIDLVQKKSIFLFWGQTIPSNSASGLKGAECWSNASNEEQIIGRWCFYIFTSAE